MDSDIQAPEPDMKNPKSPEPMDESAPSKNETKEGEEAEEVEEEEGKEEEGRKSLTVHRAKRERRPGGNSSATMCQVCNIQLNSSAQAQIHYRGKTHQRRLRRLAKVVSAGALTQSQIHPLLGSLPLPGRPLQAQAQLEHFLPLRVNGSTPLTLFPNFNAMDPVQKAVINHTFGSAPPKKKPIISCNICHLRFNSTTQAEAHYKGHKHARKLKALETQRNRQKNASSSPKEREKEREPTDSSVTDATVQSIPTEPAQPEPETETGVSVLPTPAPLPSCSDSPELSPQVSPQVSPEVYPDSQLSDQALDCPSAEGCSSEPCAPSDSQGSPMEESDTAVKMEEGKEAKTKKNLHCPTCKVTVNSSSQLEAHCSGSKHKQMVDGHCSSHSQRRIKMASSPRPTCRIKPRLGSKTRAVHMNSRRHKERLAGKPVKPKFTPYNKLQPSAILATKLAIQKHLSKALPAGFLTSPLNPLCTMASGPLALRLPPGPAPIYQGPLISPTLFRPAPGPLRATHTPIIFSPY
ncbi:zinc finger protein 385B-like isoform X2 [Eucyclogobius newberryi]|uniref:zinc finger protein 385B-like isoform X2 n=1 Tax=Eucyclogobius newberryi TaxID=166745 RepID=UPI003B58EBDA